MFISVKIVSAALKRNWIWLSLHGCVLLRVHVRPCFRPVTNAPACFPVRICNRDGHFVLPSTPEGYLWDCIPTGKHLARLGKLSYVYRAG